MKNINKKQKIIVIFIILIVFTIYNVYKKSLEKNSNSFNELIELNNTKENEIADNNKDNENQEKEEQEEKIKVHVSGQVKNEGVYELDNGCRVIDAINKAGGLTEEADTTQINLAYIIEDASKIYVPKIGEEQNEKTEEQTKQYSETKQETTQNKTTKSKININTASKDELDTLPGIGEVTAQKIIEYREERGKFSKIEDIKEVSGIGDNKFEKIKDLIDV